MRRRGVRELITYGVLVFAVLLAAIEATVRNWTLRWPAWVATGVLGAVTAVVMVVSPVRDVVAGAWAGAVGRRIARWERERGLVGEVTGGRKRLRLVRELGTHRELLGIHEAIALPPGVDSSLSPELPLYIPRDVDLALTTWIKEHAASGGMLVLSGPAAAGKTRALIEALIVSVGDWQMFMPENAEQIAFYLDSSTGESPLVVWLNELHEFLGSGGLKAATVRRLLAGSRAILLVGTIWPERFHTLAGVVEEGSQELNRDAREILTVLAHREHVEASFSQGEHERAQVLSERDPRIAAALAYPAESLTGNLAAAPALVAAWRDPDDPYAHAVVRAAVVARRCGHPPIVPIGVLEPLAAYQLTARQRAAVGADWFGGALRAACEPLPEVRVSRLHAASAQPGMVDGYEVSDILVQHDASALGEMYWRVVINTAAPEACLDIGVAAYLEAGELALAIEATTKAVNARKSNHAPAAYNLGVLLGEKGDHDGEKGAYQFAIDSGHADEAPRAAFNLGVLLQQQDDVDGARRAYQLAIDSGHADEAPEAAFTLGDLLANRGDAEGAQAAYQLAMQAGRTEAGSAAALNLGVLLQRQGDVEGAQTAFQVAIDSGHTPAFAAAYNLGVLFQQQGDVAGAHRAYKSAIDSGYPEAGSFAALNLGVLLQQQGDVEGARRAYQLVIEFGYAAAASLVNASLEPIVNGRDEVDDLRRSYQLAVDSGHAEKASKTAFILGDMLIFRGDTAGAQTAFQLAIDSAHTEDAAAAAVNLGALLQEQGDVEGAQAAFQVAIDSGYSPAFAAAHNLGALLDEQGDVEGARRAYQIAIESGRREAGSAAALNLGVLLQRQGDLEGAHRAYLMAIEFGNTETTLLAKANLEALPDGQGGVMTKRVTIPLRIGFGHTFVTAVAKANLEILSNAEREVETTPVADQLVISPGWAGPAGRTKHTLLKHSTD